MQIKFIFSVFTNALGKWLINTIDDDEVGIDILFKPDFIFIYDKIVKRLEDISYC